MAFIRYLDKNDSVEAKLFQHIYNQEYRYKESSSRYAIENPFYTAEEHLKIRNIINTILVNEGGFDTINATLKLTTRIQQDYYDAWRKKQETFAETLTTPFCLLNLFSTCAFIIIQNMYLCDYLYSERLFLCTLSNELKSAIELHSVLIQQSTVNHQVTMRPS